MPVRLSWLWYRSSRRHFLAKLIAFLVLCSVSSIQIIHADPSITFEYTSPKPVLETSTLPPDVAHILSPLLAPLSHLTKENASPLQNEDDCTKWVFTNVDERASLPPKISGDEPILLLQLDDLSSNNEPQVASDHIKPPKQNSEDMIDNVFLSRHIVIPRTGAYLNAPKELIFRLSFDYQIRLRPHDCSNTAWCPPVVSPRARVVLSCAEMPEGVWLLSNTKEFELPRCTVAVMKSKPSGEPSDQSLGVAPWCHFDALQVLPECEESVWVRIHVRRPPPVVEGVTSTSRYEIALKGVFTSFHVYMNIDPFRLASSYLAQTSSQNSSIFSDFCSGSGEMKRTFETEATSTGMNPDSIAAQQFRTPNLPASEQTSGSYVWLSFQQIHEKRGYACSVPPVSIRTWSVDAIPHSLTKAVVFAEVWVSVAAFGEDALLRTWQPRVELNLRWPKDRTTEHSTMSLIPHHIIAIPWPPVDFSTLIPVTFRFVVTVCPSMIQDSVHDYTNQRVQITLRVVLDPSDEHSVPPDASNAAWSTSRFLLRDWAVRLHHTADTLHEVLRDPDTFDLRRVRQCPGGESLPVAASFGSSDDVATTNPLPVPSLLKDPYSILSATHLTDETVLGEDAASLLPSRPPAEWALDDYADDLRSGAVGEVVDVEQQVEQEVRELQSVKRHRVGKMTLAMYLGIFAGCVGLLVLLSLLHFLYRKLYEADHLVRQPHRDPKRPTSIRTKSHKKNIKEAHHVPAGSRTMELDCKSSDSESDVTSPTNVRCLKYEIPNSVTTPAHSYDAL